MFREKLTKWIADERDGRPAAVIINPMTGVPDFDGYRPSEGELPQSQPVSEMIQYEVSGESAEEMLARVIAQHDAPTSNDKEGE